MEFCRLCLAEGLELSDIYEKESSDLSYHEIAQEIAAVDPNESFPLSSRICSPCKTACSAYLRFREQIRSSYEHQKGSLINATEIAATDIASCDEFLEDDEVLFEVEEKEEDFATSEAADREIGTHTEKEKKNSSESVRSHIRELQFLS